MRRANSHMVRSYANYLMLMNAKLKQQSSSVVTQVAIVVAVEWRSQSLLHKSQCNDSALHLSCRASPDRLKAHYFYSACPTQCATSLLAANS